MKLTGSYSAVLTTLRQSAQCALLFHKTVVLIRIYTILMVALLSTNSCNQSEKASQLSNDKKIIAQNLLKVSQLVTSKPDSALKLADFTISQAQQAKWNDTVVIALLQLKANAYLKQRNVDSAKINFERARLKAILISDTRWQATIDLKYGELMLDKGNLYTAEKYLGEAVEILDKGSDKFKQGEAYNLYGGVLADRGDILKSQHYHFKAYVCFENTDSLAALGKVCNNLASNFKAQGSKNDALIYYQKALNYSLRAKDTGNITSVLNNLGIFYRTSSPDSSFNYYNKVLSLVHPGKNSRMEIITRYNMANLYFDNKQYEKAKSVYLSLLDICRSGKNVGGVARIYISLAAFYSKTGNYPVARKYLNDAISLSDSIGDKKINTYSLNELKELYIKTKDYKDALDLSVIIKKSGDSTLLAEKKAAVHEIEMLYISEKKDAENAKLKYQIGIQQTNLEYRMMIIFLFILATGVMSILIYRLSKLYRQRGIAYQQLVSKFKLESELMTRLGGIRQTTSKTNEDQDAEHHDIDLLKELIDFYVKERPYLDSKLKVATIAEKLNTSQKAISNSLKGYTDSNFATFTNRFRVDAAIRMMDDSHFRNYKIEAIAKDSGFGSKSNFYDTFESFTGVKPNYYRSRIAEQVSEME